MRQATELRGDFVRVNQAACDLLGYTRTELETRSIRHVIPSEMHEAVDERMQALASGEISRVRVERQYRRKDGSLVWVEVNESAVRDTAGAIQYLIGQVQDISARRETEEQLRRSQDLYRLVVDNSRDLISLIDLDARFVFVSSAITFGSPSRMLPSTKIEPGMTT